jgi:hypothetical protein
LGDTPAPELLAQVRRAWAEVLDAGEPDLVPLDVHFLEAGGSSLLLIMLWEQLSELTDRPLKVSDLFEHATVRSQAALLAGADRPPGAAAVPGAHDRRALLARGRSGKE